ncbi:TolC family protein [Robiginitomaculum antarcticum]|uniref:TolC family protein n=1 Tax=Robiginitomaculum antarcticum TaxID=437507 RepID=UPI00039FBAA3|nr:TolC family protein [Robiginitomaculum antarcticum]
MLIRYIPFHHYRLRAAIFSLTLSSISAVCLTPSALAQDDIYAPELLVSQGRYNAPLPQAEARPMRFSEVEANLRQHPSLDALNLSADAYRHRAEAALGLPDPVISLQINNVPFINPSFSEYLPSNKAIGVRQAFPSRSGRKANSLLSLRNAAQHELKREQQFARLRGDLLMLLIEERSIDGQRDYALARQTKYDELADIIDIEINAGRPIVFRLAQVDVERTEVSRTLARLDGQESEIEAAFVNLLGFIPQTDLPDLSKTVWTGQALRFYGVRVADAQVAIADAEVQRAKADYKPDWGANLTYQQRESSQGLPRSNFDGDDWVSGGISFTIPLWARDRQDPNLRAAKIDKNASLARRMAIARRFQSEWSRYDAKRETAVQNISILKQKISAIEAQTASELISYEAGMGDYSPILDGEIAVLMLRAEIVKEEATRDQMVVAMNSLLVTP